MSTNVPGGSHPDGHCTVAELVARERGTAEGEASGGAERTSPMDTTATQRLHVSELLRREGFDGSGPAELAHPDDTEATAPAALSARPRERTGSGSRGPWVGKAAVLFGLTIGGLIGLQSTVSSSMIDSTGSQADVKSGNALASAGELRSSSTVTGGTGTSDETAPSTSPQVRLRSKSTPLPQQSSERTHQQNPVGDVDVTAGNSTGYAAGRPTASEPTPPPTTERQARFTTSTASRQSAGSPYQQEKQNLRQGTQVQRSYTVTQTPSGSSSTTPTTGPTTIPSAGSSTPSGSPSTTPTTGPNTPSGSPSTEGSPSNDTNGGSEDSSAHGPTAGTLAGVLDEITDLLGL